MFLTWNGSGNQTPALGLAQALHMRGHDIAFAGYESQRARVAAQGVRFATLQRSNAALQITTHRDIVAAEVAAVWATPAHFDDVRDAVAREAPDLLVIDCFLFGALAAAELQHLPAVVLVHGAPGLQIPPGGPFERFRLLEPVNALRSAVELPLVATMWENWAHFPTLCASLPALDPLAASVPPSFVYVGPIQEHMQPTGWRAPWPDEDLLPVVLVSFSGNIAWDQTSRIQRTLTGLAEQPVHVLVTASRVDSAVLTIPANAYVVPFVPHEEVLSQTSVTVTHAGHGTVTAALAHGVPLICLPNPASDQPGLAAQVAALGAGIALDGDTAPPAAIGDAVRLILADPSFTTTARRLATIISATNAPATAATWLEACVTESRSSLLSRNDVD